MTTTKRVSMTLSNDVLRELDGLCSRLSVTRSSLVSEILRQNLASISSILDMVCPEGPDGNIDSVRRRDPEELRSLFKSLTQDLANAAVQEMDEMELTHGKH